MPKVFKHYFAKRAPSSNDPRLEEAAELWDRVQPTITPKSPEWGARLFFDSDRFPTDAEREKIRNLYENKYPGRSFVPALLTLSNLQHSMIFKYAKAERLFKENGYVSDIDETSFGRGRIQPDTAYLARNKAAMHRQVWLVNDLIRRLTPPTKWGHDDDLGALMGQADGTPIPLTERNGVFLPQRQFWRQENIHFAFSQSLDEALAAAQNQKISPLFAFDEKTLEQIEFEAQHSTGFFNGATPTALVLWHAQVLAYLRKAVWEIDFDTGTALNTIEIDFEARKASMRRHLMNPHQGGWELLQLYDKGPVRLALADLEDKTRDDFDQEILERGKPDFYGIAHGIAEYCWGLTTEQNVVAALHGATYLPDFDWDRNSDRYHPLHKLQPVGLWLSDLKITKRATLDRNMAGLLAAIFEDRAAELPEEEWEFGELVPYQNLIADRLGLPAWQVLSDRIYEMLDQEAPEPMPVEYEWSRDPENPWHADFRHGTIFIRGPLLDFPISAAGYWNKTAIKTVNREPGFIRARRDDENGKPI